MRFKASIAHARFASFWAHVHALERVGKKATFIFSAATVRVICQSEADSMMQYSSIATGAVFSAFRCESRSDNIIALEVLVANAVAGLASGAGAEAVTLKLTKRGAAQYLRVESAPRAGGVALVQDVPVRVLATQEMLRCGPPVLPPPGACLFLPGARALCAVADRLRGVAKALRVEAATPRGAPAELVLGADADAVSTRTYFRALVGDVPPPEAAGGAGGDEAEEEAAADARAAAAGARIACHVSAKDFAKTAHGVADLAAAHAVSARLALVAGIALYVNVRLEDDTGEVTFIHSIMPVAE